MNSLVLAGLMMVGYFVAYHTYGKFLARKIFKLNPEAVCPSSALRDDHDFIPWSAVRRIKNISRSR